MAEPLPLPGAVLLLVANVGYLCKRFTVKSPDTTPNSMDIHLRLHNRFIYDLVVRLRKVESVFIKTTFNAKLTD